MTPMPALIFSALLLSAPVTGYQAVGAIVVTAGVLLALAPAFGLLSRRRAADDGCESPRRRTAC